MRCIITLGLFLSFHTTQAQTSLSSSEIFHEIKKLQKSSRVLYVAAHPDDENTRMISWLVNDLNITTAYLSLTRGDGGQNLIGTELGAELGVLRTQELMQARAIDGGEQYFSRAVDFGYSKTAEETFEKWGKQEILADVVWVIRNFRPDVIITRFPTDSRGGHGHHTASAILALEAFEKASDVKAFSNQLDKVKPWQAKRIYWNASTWWNPKLDSIAKHDPDYIAVEVGGYNKLIGSSSNELASLSRTQHKSQGFGVSVSRGSEMEYLQYLGGEEAANNLFEGFSADWERFGFEEGDRMLREIIRNFDHENPQYSVQALLKLKQKAGEIRDEARRDYFKKQIDEIVVAALGIHLEALADQEYYHPGDRADIEVELIYRNPMKDEARLIVDRIESDADILWSDQRILKVNETEKFELKTNLTNDYSEPYWLKKEYANIFEVSSQDLIGKAENPKINHINVRFAFSNEPGMTFQLRVPFIHKYSDRVEGEIINEVQVIPGITVESGHENLIFTSNESKRISLNFNFHREQEIQVKLQAEGWKVSPSQFVLKGGEATHIDKEIQIEPLVGAKPTSLKIWINDVEALQLVEINYSHIDKRILLKNAGLSLVNIDLKKEGERIGYIIGAGDKVPEAISLMGYEVDILDEEKLKTADLSIYQAIVAGIRAYNTQDWLPSSKSILMDYIQKGGVYIVQYNTRSRDLLSTDIGPYPFEISRNRVTEEDAEVNFDIPHHAVLNKPNKISAQDFENWVQERGLYFADNWSDVYETPLAWHDEGEEDLKGGLLIAKYGEGAFIYTGISFFRELPAGVPGAYRLLANLLSYKSSSSGE